MRKFLPEFTDENGGTWSRCAINDKYYADLRPERLRLQDTRGVRVILISRLSDLARHPSLATRGFQGEEGLRLLEELVAEARAEAGTRGFSTLGDLPALWRLHNEETLQLHREGKELGPNPERICSAEKPCDTCRGILIDSSMSPSVALAKANRKENR